jgi:hypothetical protein
MAAWVAARVFGTRWNAPLDGGRSSVDGSRWLGDHKTWRGLIAAVVACGVAAQLLRLGFGLGAACGALALLVLQRPLGLSLVAVLVVAVVFMLLNVAASKVRHS